MDGVTIRSQLPLPGFHASSPTFIHADTHCFNCYLEMNITISQALLPSPQMHLALTSYRAFHHTAIAQFPSIAVSASNSQLTLDLLTMGIFARAVQSQEKESLGKGFWESVASGPADVEQLWGCRGHTDR